MKQKIAERLEAIDLRGKGYSVNEIVGKIGVAKASVSVWVRNVHLTSDARKRLLTKIKNGQLISAENRRRKTHDVIMHHRREAQKELEGLKIDQLLGKIICALLYWCEGAKSPSRGVRFTNSDPRLMRAFVRLMRNSFEVDEKKIRVGVHLHEYHNVERQLSFWSHIVSVPRNKFLRPYLKPHTGKRIRKDYPGCATIYYHSNDMARQLLVIAETCLEKMGA